MTTIQDQLVGIYGQIVQIVAETERLTKRCEQLRQDVRALIDTQPDSPED